MRYFKTVIISNSDKKTTKKILESLIEKSVDDFLVLPFCLFSKSFYSSIKRRKQRPFSGTLTENEFELYMTAYYHFFSLGRTDRYMKLKGKLFEQNGKCLIDIEFHSFAFEVILELILFIGLIVLFFIYKNPIFIVIPVLILLDKLRLTMFLLMKIKRRLKRFESEKKN